MKLQHFIPQLISASFLLLIATEASLNALPFEAPPDGTQSNERSSFDGGLGNGFNPMNLIHRANLTPSRKSEDFNNDSKQNIQSAAEKFKQQQMQKIQPSSTPTNGITSPLTP